MAHRGLQAGADELGRGGEHHLGPVSHRLLQQGFRFLRRVGAEVAADSDGGAQRLLQMLAAQIVGGGPGAGLRRALVDEGHMDVVQPQQVEKTRLAFGGRCFRADHRVGVGGGDEVFPHVFQTFFQRCGPQAAQVAVPVDLQPNQQCFFRRHGQAVAAQLEEDLAEVVEAGAEAAAVLLRPILVRRKAHAGGQLGKVTGLGEHDIVELGMTVEVQKLVVSHDLRVVAELGQNAVEHGVDAGSAIVFQYAQPLVALLDIEVAQIFIADQGITDALVAEMVAAQADPFGGKLRALRQQRQKAGREGGGPAGNLHADKAFHRDLRLADLTDGLDVDALQQLVQNGRMGRFSPGEGFLLLFQTLLQGSLVLGVGRVHMHGNRRSFPVKFCSYCYCIKKRWLRQEKRRPLTGLSGRKMGERRERKSRLCVDFSKLLIYDKA